METRRSERGMDQPDSANGRESLLADGQGDKGAQTSERGTPWGFLLVLAAVVMITVIYAVTMLTIGPEIQNPTTAIGAMTVAFTVISTLVGIYFGIKAGLDGQDKAKEIVDKAVRGGERLRRDHGE